MNNGEQYVDTQIDYVTNNKNLIAASNSLTIPLSEEKSQAGLHGKYSRIRFTMTQFDKEPSICVFFYLKPAEIRRLYNRVMRLGGNKAYSFNSFKKYEHKAKDDGRIGASSMTVERTPYEIDFQTGEIKKDAKGAPKRINLPWQITIAEGSCTKDGKAFKAEKTVRKRLLDTDMEDFFSNIVAHIQVWETVVAGKHLARLLAQRNGQASDFQPAPDMVEESEAF